jgi:predicted transcriptional regulator
MRTTTISVSYDEKRRLDEAAEELCGTTEVPYGEVIAQLVAEATDV